MSTSPLPVFGSGTSPITRGLPNSSSTAALIAVSVPSAQHLACETPCHAAVFHTVMNLVAGQIADDGFGCCSGLLGEPCMTCRAEVESWLDSWNADWRGGAHSQDGARARLD